MIERLTSVERINVIVNHPSIRPWVCASTDEALDLSGVVANANNVALFGAFGGVIFTLHQAGLYEAHTQVLPEGRGEWAEAMVREALHWMFCRTGAVEIVTRVPRGNIAARVLTQRIGGVFEFRAKNAGTFRGKLVDHDWYALRIQDWMRDDPSLPERGEWFHRRLTQEYELFGVQEPLHIDDPVHDRYVGAAVDMMIGGQPEKAVVFYNRWAVMSGYELISIVTVSPLVVDIRDALLFVRANDFWVIQCQLEQ